MAKVFTLAEVSEHSNSKDCWLVIGGKVYDVTKFLDDHPGGDDILINATGKDATEDFDDIRHSPSAMTKMEEFLVGEIDVYTIPAKKAYPSQAASLQSGQDTRVHRQAPPVLSPFGHLGLGRWLPFIRQIRGLGFMLNLRLG